MFALGLRCNVFEQGFYLVETCSECLVDGIDRAIENKDASVCSEFFFLQVELQNVVLLAGAAVHFVEIAWFYEKAIAGI